MLTAYFDESYNHRTEKNPNEPLVYTVGCWISTDAQWKKFGKKWRSALNSAQIESFHMNKFESRLGEYADWSELKRVGVLRRLHRIIKDYTLHGITVTVNREAYDELITNERRRTFGKTYYGFDVQICLRRIAEWCEQNGYEEPVKYVFADLKGQGGDLDVFFRTILSKPSLREYYRCDGMWTKGLMKDVVQLQAADIAAYELNKRAVNHISRGDKFIRRSLQNLRLFKNFDPLYFGRDEILKWMDEINRASARGDAI